MQVLENIDLRHSTALPRQNKKKILEKTNRLLEIIYSIYCGKSRSFTIEQKTRRVHFLVIKACRNF